MPPYFSLEEYVVHEGTDHSLQNFLPPHFPRKESNVIVETLRCEMMVMLGSQPMDVVLC